ncbi:Nuclear aminoacylation-dependent tRNA export pathway component [Exophiala xenobiotica]|uniref:Nuclear aminoacylation-dependent tRNA export pathway component n=1 Tax=Lithohypha guttulata TaxID=1690604 RepID=A0ABR0K9N7_9EURO|nr:Nuclear aminoacylation-dependent tRNA export pathway component [Lithohypha guttulata]KAK5318400.1 Nuclear aminoacylation-dependent tRNA export pathway component [Exophiala xenobiotica]
MDFLKSAVASAIAKSSSFPYTIGERVDLDASIWTLSNATKKDDNSPCSVFTFDIASQRSYLPLAKNAARKLRTLRHPGVIRVLDVIESETHIYIATEKVTPLSWHTKRRSLSEETVKWGLYTVSSTLKFINNDASAVHGNVRVGSVYTSDSGEWKLAGFDVLSSMNEDDAIIYNYGGLVPDSNRYAPPEIMAGGWSAIKKNPLYAPDSFGLGTLVHEAFNGTFTGTDRLAQPGSIPAIMVAPYKRLVNNNPKLRLSAGHFVEQGKKAGGFFETPLIHITEGADSLGLKNEQERDQFLNELDGLTDDFPEDFFKIKILPELLKSVEFGGGGPKVFGAILKVGAKMSDDEWETKLLPLILRLFASPDRAMRVCLLDNLSGMIDRIPQKDVNGKIFPMMVTGFTDTAPVVREQTVKAVLTVITKLSDRTINGELLRYLAKTANDEQPGIRTNTTICLGKIARNLGTSSRTKVLIAAFTRSLRDPFVHARNAALMAFTATSDVFSEEDCATKVLPAICLSLIDKEKLVRDTANKAFDTYTARVKKYAETLPDTATPSANADGVRPSTPARIGNQNDASGWAGWAISSFTNKLSTAKGEMNNAPAMATNGAALTQTKSLPTSGRATPTISAVQERPAAVRLESTTTSQRTSVEQPSEPAAEDDAMDAWGEFDEDGDNFFDAPSANKPPTSAAAPFDDGGEPDFAGWLAAQNKPKSKPPLPRGLSKPTNGTGLAPRPTATRSVSSGLPTAKKVVPAIQKKPAAAPVPAKKVDLTPKDGGNEDDWGAWD